MEVKRREGGDLVVGVIGMNRCLGFGVVTVTEIMVGLFVSLRS